MSHIVRRLVREILKEDQAYKRLTGKKFTADIEKFRDTVDKPGYYIHLTDTPKLGVRPKSGYLPGIYLYPHTKVNYEAVMLGHGPGNIVAGRAARYVFLVKLREGLNLMKADNMDDALNRKLEGIVRPILDATLDTRLMKNPANMRKYFEKDGNFQKWSALSSVVPVLQVTPKALEETGDDTYVKSVHKIISLADEMRSLEAIKGKENRSKAAEDMNGRVRDVLRSTGMYPQDIDGVPHIRGITKHNSLDPVGLKVTDSGLVSGAGIQKATLNILGTIKGAVDIDARTRTAVINAEKVKGLSEKPPGGLSERFHNDKLFQAIAEKYKNTAMFYFNIMRAGGASTRAHAIDTLIRDSRGGISPPLVGKDGGDVDKRELSNRLLDAVLEAMSRPGTKVTRETLKKYVGQEEVNILLALGGDDYDGVEDIGKDRPGYSGTKTGSLGIEGQQTLILPPIGSKLEGGGPIVMVDRMEGLAADKTPAGSIHGTAVELYQDESPREVEISRSRHVPDDEFYAAKNAGKSISRTRERFSTARDYPKEDV